VAVLVSLSAGLGLSAAACGKYSISNLKATKAWKEGNEAYGKADWKEAADKYEAALQDNPNPAPDSNLNTTYFYLGNSYDQMYKPSRKGQPDNDAYLQKAVENYKLATEHEIDPARRKLAYEYLIATYGPDKLNDFDKAEPLAKKLIELEPNEPVNYTALGGLYEEVKRLPEAEAAFKMAVEVKPSDPAVYQYLAGYYNRHGQFEKTIEALEQRAEREPNNPEAFHMVATYYEDEAFKDVRLDSAKKVEYIKKGLAADDRALAINPNYPEALIYKNILLRMEGNMEPNLTKRAELYKEADQVREKGMEMQKQQNAAAAARGRGGQ
jgi:tetratricopeptide (TPR) repeat protein